jgi:hypothetical protein
MNMPEELTRFASALAKMAMATLARREVAVVSNRWGFNVSQNGKIAEQSYTECMM